MRKFALFVLTLSLLLLVPGSMLPSQPESISAQNGECPGSEIPPVSAALHVLPPIGKNSGDLDELDRTLTDYLSIRLCSAGTGCDCEGSPVLTSQPTNHGMDYIRLQDEFYHVNWHLVKADKGKAFDLCFDVAGLFVGSVGYTQKSSGRVPIRFRIDRDPTIRARVLHEEGHPALEIAQVLKDEFALGALDVARILHAEGFSLPDLIAVLDQIFQVSDVLALESNLRCLGFAPEEYLEHTARTTVEALAPVLKFDGAWSGEGLPMSAQLYFERVMLYNGPQIEGGEIWWSTPYYGPPCDPYLGIIPLPGRDDSDPPRCGMSNNDFMFLTLGRIPTYYRVIDDGNHERLRIAYWWFYGWQPPCNDGLLAMGNDGAHHGDWEHILVTTSTDRSRADYVTYFFHGDWYTRQWGAFYVEGQRPVVYVGKLGHGSYHTNASPSCWMLGTPSHCCQYADCRNPNASTWWYTDQNLVSLNSNSQPWMLADRVGSTYEVNGQQYQIRSWRWGPVHAFCHTFQFICCAWDDQCCCDWSFVASCGTHPTVDSLDWTIPSCDGTGCGQADCSGLVYPHEADWNQPWPWDG